MTSKIVVNNIEADAGINTVTISGDVTATNITGAHHGSAANLTSIPAAQLTGTVADARISALTSSKLTGALPAIDGSALTGVASTTGGGAIYENSATISASRTIPSGSNGMSAGPIAVADGVTLTVSSGSVYTVV